MSEHGNFMAILASFGMAFYSHQDTDIPRWVRVLLCAAWLVIGINFILDRVA